MNYTRGRIVLTYYLRFPLMGVILFFAGLFVMALTSDQPLLYELRVFRILPLIIALYFALFPLSLLIGFWVGNGYNQEKQSYLIQDGLVKGMIASALYSFLLLGLNYLFRDNQSLLILASSIVGLTLLGGAFSYIIARGIVNKGEERLKKDF